MNKKTATAILVGISMVGTSKAYAEFQCQFQVNFGGDSGFYSGIFMVNPQNNGFTNAIMTTPNGTYVGGGGNYLSNLAVVSFPSSYVSVLLSPQTGKVVNISQLGNSVPISSSKFQCTPALTPPTCQQYVDNLNQTVMHGRMSSGQRNNFISECESKARTPDQIQADLYNSLPYATQNTSYQNACGSLVTNLYHEFLFRDPDALGLQGWTKLCQSSSLGLGKVAQGILASDEYNQTKHASLGTGTTRGGGGGGSAEFPTIIQDRALPVQATSSSDPNASYTTLYSPTGAQQINGLNTLINQEHPDLNSPDAQSHDVN